MNKEKFLELIGPFPQQPQSLNIRTVEVVDCGSYSRHKLEYSVEPDEKIAAYVCIPKNITDKVPGILCHHQHDGKFDLGKSEVVGLAGDPDHAYAVELVERGYVTFAFDALAFEDRNWHDEAFLAETYEATARITQGKTFMAKLLSDISIGLDVLCSINEVDSERIGFLGYSYGGKMTFWATAYDERIKAAVSHCGSISLKRSLERDGGILPELTIPRFLEFGDVVDVAKLSKASLLISGTTEDVWSENAQETHDELQQNSSVDSELAIYEGVHRFSDEMRENAYRFLDKKLEYIDLHSRK